MRGAASPVALALLVLLAGCLKVDVPADPAPAADDGRTTLDLTVVHATSETALEGAEVVLSIPGKGTARGETNGDGRIRFTVDPAPTCTLTASKDGFQGGAVAIDCRQDRFFRIPLKPLGSGSGSGLTSGTLPTLPAAGSKPPVPGSVVLQGQVLDAANRLPIPGVTVQVDAPAGDAMVTGLDGRYAFAVLPGAHVLSTDAPCWVKAHLPVEVEDGRDQILDIQLAGDVAPPPVPTGLRAAGGPGPGMVAVAWQAVPGAAGYDLLRGDPPAPLVRLDGSLAYGVHEASAGDRFWVASRNSCGFSSAPAGPVSAEPMQGTPLTPMSVTEAPFDAEVRTFSYPVLDPNGTVVRQAAWRTVLGTGNCCENHVVTSRGGAIVDIGSDTVYESRDEGQTWRRVAPLVPPLCGEGAGAPAPAGDLVMFDWVSCLPLMDDQVFALKYSASTGRWYSQILPIHSPFYDRPWMAVVEGPFDVQGLIVPYLTFAIGGYPSKEVMLVSLDGLHFLVPSSSYLDGLVGAGVSLPALDLAPDVGRDWLQPSTNSGLAPLDHGLGLRYGLSLAGAPQLLQDGLTWGDAQLGEATLPSGAAIQADSRGTLHAIEPGEGSFTYSWSHDGGRTWDSLRQDVGGGLSVWDFRAQSGLDQTVVSAKVDKSGGDDQVKVFRYKGLAGTPRLVEVLLVGSGDVPFRGNLAGGGARFDFMTVGFLPDGRVVTSFGDSQHGTPALAIELPASP